MKYLTIISAILLSAMSGFFSIYGIAHIFSLSFWPIIIMGAVLELAKISTAIYIHKHWTKIGILLRYYLALAMIVLMVITSIGIFSYLATASQSLTNELYKSQIQIKNIQGKLDQVIRNKQMHEIELKSLDKIVDKYIVQEKFADVRRGVKLLGSQKQVRDELKNKIESLIVFQDKLELEITVLLQKIKNENIDIGPAIFLSQSIFGNDSVESIEGAIRIVIFMIMFSFDPLAISLMLAIQKVEEHKNKEPAKEVIAPVVENVVESVAPVVDEIETFDVDNIVPPRQLTKAEKRVSEYVKKWENKIKRRENK